MTLDGPTAADPLDESISAATILGTTYPPVEYVVPGLIPEGLTMLVASPKIGKSWLVLGLALASASGGVALGRLRVDRRPVLYLALEDGERRLQGRLRTIHGTPEAGLLFKTSLGHFGPVDVISAFIDRHAEDRPLVILDTLGKVRGVGNGADNYGRDYTQMSQLKHCVDSCPGSSLIVVHHTNKGEHGDFLSGVSGTQGLAGASDTIAVIQRERNSPEGALHITSRDAMEGSYGVRFEGGAWTLDGDTLTEAAQSLNNRETREGTGDTMKRIVSAVQQHPEGTGPRDVAEATGVDDATVRRYLRRAVDGGRIKNPSRGVYTPVTTVTSVTTEGDTPPGSDTCDRCDTPCGRVGQPPLQGRHVLRAPRPGVEVLPLPRQQLPAPGARQLIPRLPTRCVAGWAAPSRGPHEDLQEPPVLPIPPHPPNVHALRRPACRMGPRAGVLRGDRVVPGADRDPLEDTGGGAEGAPPDRQHRLRGWVPPPSRHGPSGDSLEARPPLDNITTGRQDHEHSEQHPEPHPPRRPLPVAEGPHGV